MAAWPRRRSISVRDFQAFERTLQAINIAWSKRSALRAVSTPEMVSYFAQDLRDLEARNWRNETRDVKLEQGDLSEAWSEDGEDYATVAMRFSMLDATFDNATNKLVEGSTTVRTEATELWTAQGPGGNDARRSSRRRRPDTSRQQRRAGETVPRPLLVSGAMVSGRRNLRPGARHRVASAQRHRAETSCRASVHGAQARRARRRLSQDAGSRAGANPWRAASRPPSAA